MPLWSLTQERVDRLLRQIADKETEIDDLIKLSKEDIWKKDLDEFLHEWRLQLEEDERRERKAAGMGRRMSSKLAGAKAPARKRKAGGDDDDEDYAPSRSKKAATSKKTETKGGILDFLNKAPKETKPAPASDESDEDFEAEILPKKNRAAPKREDASPKEEEDVVMADKPAEKPAAKAAAAESTTSRSRPTTERKPAARSVLSDSDSDNGDALLDDVGKMVKGIGDSKGRSLISDHSSRPGSSSGLKSSTTKASKLTSEFDADETDYSKLVPKNSPRRSLTVKPRDVKMADADDDDDEEASKPKSKLGAKGKSAAAKSTAAPKSRGRPKKDASKAEPAKKTQPAKGRGKKKLLDDSDDEIDAMANDILDSPAAGKSDNEEAPPARSRPARRAAATAKKPVYVIDDDSEDAIVDDRDDDDDDFGDDLNDDSE